MLLKYFIRGMAGGCLPLLFVACHDRQAKISVKPLAQLATDTFNTIEVKTSLPVLPMAGGETVRLKVPSRDCAAVRTDRLVSSYRFIPLETGDECIIGEIQKLYVNDAGIWVHDLRNNALFRFDLSGKFICRIGRQGRGAKEFLRLWGFSIDEQRKEVCVHDVDGLKLEYYDFDGRHLRTSPLYYQYSDMEIWKDKMVTCTMSSYNPFLPTVSAFQLVVTRRDYVPQYGILSNVPNPYEKGSIVCPAKAIRRGTDGLYYSNVFSDTIWWTDGTRYKAAYWLDFGKRGPLFTRGELAGMTLEKYENQVNAVPMYFNGVYLPTPKFLWVDVRGTKDGVQFLYCRSTGNVLPISNVSRPSLTSQVGDYLFPYNGKFDFVYDDSTFVKVLQPYHMQYLKKSPSLLARFPQAERRFWENLDEEANPILMLITLKEF